VIPLTYHKSNNKFVSCQIIDFILVQWCCLIHEAKRVLVQQKFCHWMGGKE